MDAKDWPEDAGRDRLIGDWHIYQRTGGHRTSTDDLITAWYAVHRNPDPPERYLDLGCGVGSVLLMVSHKLRPKIVLGVEAQAQSLMMARRAVAELPEHGSHIELRQADFRDVDFGGKRYDLITASPPYFPIGTGVLPDDPQRRAWPPAPWALSLDSTSCFRHSGVTGSRCRLPITACISAAKRISQCAPMTLHRF